MVSYSIVKKIHYQELLESLNHLKAGPGSPTARPGFETEEDRPARVSDTALEPKWAVPVSIESQVKTCPGPNPS